MSQLSNWQITIGGNQVQAAIQYSFNGVPIQTPGWFLTVNFKGAGVTAADAGGHQLDVTIPGGGSSINVIDTNTTLSVPSGPYPTIAAALAYALDSVVLKGVTVTIQFTGAALTEQVVLTGLNVPWLNFTNTGAVNVDSTGFVANAFGAKALFQLTNSTVGTISGNWNQSAGPAASGYYAIISRGTVQGATFTGWGAGVAVDAAGHTIVAACTLSGGAGVGGLFGGTLIADGCTITGTVNAAQAADGGIVDIVGCSLTSGASVLVSASCGIINSIGNTLHPPVAGVVMQANGGAITSESDTVATSLTGGTVLDSLAGGNLTVSGMNVTLDAGGSTTAFASASGASVRVASVNVTNTSTGSPATATGAGNINIGTATINASFTGLASPLSGSLATPSSGLVMF